MQDNGTENSHHKEAPKFDEKTVLSDGTTIYDVLREESSKIIKKINKEIDLTPE